MSTEIPGSTEGKDFKAPDTVHEGSEGSQVGEGGVLVATEEADNSGAIAVTQGEIAAMETDLTRAEIEDKLKENLQLVSDWAVAVRNKVLEMQQKFRVPGFRGRREKRLLRYVHEEARRMQGMMQGVEGYGDAELQAFDVRKQPDDSFPRDGSSGWPDRTPRTPQEKLFSTNADVVNRVYHLANVSSGFDEGNTYQGILSKLDILLDVVQEVL